MDYIKLFENFRTHMPSEISYSEFDSIMKKHNHVDFSDSERKMFEIDRYPRVFVTYRDLALNIVVKKTAYPTKDVSRQTKKIYYFHKFNIYKSEDEYYLIEFYCESVNHNLNSFGEKVKSSSITNSKFIVCDQIEELEFFADRLNKFISSSSKKFTLIPKSSK